MLSCTFQHRPTRVLRHKTSGTKTVVLFLSFLPSSLPFLPSFLSLSLLSLFPSLFLFFTITYMIEMQVGFLRMWDLARICGSNVLVISASMFQTQSYDQ